jgi:hypothetical protein
MCVRVCVVVVVGGGGGGVESVAAGNKARDSKRLSKGRIISSTCMIIHHIDRLRYNCTNEDNVVAANNGTYPLQAGDQGADGALFL